MSEPEMFTSEILAAQMAAGALAPDGKTPKYRYLSAAQVYEAARSAMPPNGVTMPMLLHRKVEIFTAEQAERCRVTNEIPVGIVHFRFAIAVENKGGKEGQRYLVIEVDQAIVVSAGRALDKAINAAQTSAQSYVIQSILGIAKDDDDIETRRDSGSSGSSARMTKREPPRREPSRVALGECPDIVEKITRSEMAKLVEAMPGGIAEGAIAQIVEKLDARDATPAQIDRLAEIVREGKREQREAAKQFLESRPEGHQLARGEVAEFLRSVGERIGEVSPDPEPEPEPETEE